MEASGYAHINKAISEDPDLTPYAFRLYAIIRGRDYGKGQGCFLSRAELARLGHMSEAQVVRALRHLRDRGYIVTRVSADGLHPNTHYCTDQGGIRETPPTPPEGGVCETRVSEGHGGGVCETPKVAIREVARVPSSHEEGVAADAADAPHGDETGPAPGAPVPFALKPVPAAGPTRKVRAKEPVAAVAPVEQPQYRVFLALCQAAGAPPADMDGHRGRACADADKALKSLTRRYTREGHADAAREAEADLCAMVAWKVTDYRREYRRKVGLPPGMVAMAYQDMAAWREAGSPGRPAPLTSSAPIPGPWPAATAGPSVGATITDQIVATFAEIERQQAEARARGEPSLRQQAEAKLRARQAEAAAGPGASS